MGETVEVRYLRLRRDGMGDRAAARQAGYASCAPSRVRKLAAKLPLLKRERGICGALDREVDQLNRRIEQLTRQRDDKRAILSLCAILEEGV